MAHVGQEFRLGLGGGLGRVAGGHQFVLERPPLGDVAQLRDQFDRQVVFVADQRGAALDPDPGPVLGHHPVFAVGAGRADTLDQVSADARQARHIVGVGEFVALAADQLFRLPAHRPAGGRNVEDGVGQIDAQDDVRRVVGQQPVAILGRAERFVGQPKMGDVEQGAEEGDDDAQVP